MGWHGNGHGHGHGHGAQAKAQVQFTAKRVGSFTHFAAQSHAVAVTSALSNDGAGPSEKTPGCESNQACLNVDAGRGATQLKTTRKKMISTEGVAQHANAGALRAVSIFLCRRLVDVH